MAEFAREQEQDEFEEAQAAQAALSGYEATRDADVEDQREYRMVPRGTPATLSIGGFELSTKGKPAVWVKIGVEEPEEYADGSSNFNLRLSLNPVTGEGKGSSGWDMLVKQVSWMYAAAHQVSSAEGKREMIDTVLSEFPNLQPDDVPEFHAALVENFNEKLPKGSRFKTKGIGIDQGGDDGKGGKYRDKQSCGTYDYPKSAKK